MAIHKVTYNYQNKNLAALIKLPGEKHDHDAAVNVVKTRRPNAINFKSTEASKADAVGQPVYDATKSLVANAGNAIKQFPSHHSKSKAYSRLRSAVNAD